MDLFVTFQKILPKRLITLFVALFASVKNRWVKNFLIRKFIAAYKVDMTEAKALSIDQYQDFNAFFTRELKPGLRPVMEGAEVVVSPADGAISEVGEITQGRILQAKGIDYSVARLLGDQDLADSLEGGSFATVYLSPKDYHRVHMPFAARLVGLKYIPGKLFSVNQRTADNLDSVFALNERLVARFANKDSKFALVMVGAMIVGGMETVLTGPIRRGTGVRDLPCRQREFIKGEEFGRFYLGSTAIMLLPQAMKVEYASDICNGTLIKMGQELGRLQV